MAKEKQTDDPPDPLRPGAYWLEIETGRRIRIIEPFVHGTGPLWTYVDSAGGSMPDSEKYPTWYEHYCDIFDFSVWNRFICEDHMKILGLAPKDIAPCETDGGYSLAAIGRGSWHSMGWHFADIVCVCRANYPNGWTMFSADECLKDTVDHLDELCKDGWIKKVGEGYMVTDRFVGALVAAGYRIEPKEQ